MVVREDISENLKIVSEQRIALILNINLQKLFLVVCNRFEDAHLLVAVVKRKERNLAFDKDRREPVFTSIAPRVAKSPSRVKILYLLHVLFLPLDPFVQMKAIDTCLIEVNNDLNVALL